MIFSLFLTFNSIFCLIVLNLLLLNNRSANSTPFPNKNEESPTKTDRKIFAGIWPKRKRSEERKSALANTIKKAEKIEVENKDASLNYSGANNRCKWEFDQKKANTMANEKELLLSSFFTKLPTEKISTEKIICNECGHIAKCCGSQNTNLKIHQRKYHPQLHAKYIQDKKGKEDFMWKLWTKKLFEEESNKVTCNECSMKFNVNRISVLGRHLEAKHPHLYKEYSNYYASRRVILDKFFIRNPEDKGIEVICRCCTQSYQVKYGDKLLINHLLQKHSNDYAKFEEWSAKLKERIWRFFHLEQEVGDKLAVCNVCEERCSLSGPKNVHLMMHLRRKHYQLYRDKFLEQKSMD